MKVRCCGVLFALMCLLDARAALAQCSYSVSPTNVSVPSTGSIGSVSITTGSSCAWTAVSSVSWITITSASSGTGLAAVSYSVASNPTGTSRVGTLTVAGRTVTITQAGGSCSYSVSPTSVSAPSTGLNATVSIITGSSCAWTATSNATWITITGPTSGTGLSSVNYTVAANTAAFARNGTLTVAGQTVVITQAAGSCAYSVSPTTVTVPSTGANNSISVITGSGCAWTAVSTASWITITSGASMSGLGSVNYTVAANTAFAPRTGTMTIAGQTVTVTQAANSCSYSVSPTTVSAPSTGTSGSVAVTTGSSCAWTATSAVAWITITAGGSMAGTGSVDYTVARNTTTASRTGVLNIAGRTVTVTQAAGTPPAAPTGFRIIQ